LIIDSHGHITAPAKVYDFQAKLIARRAWMPTPKLSDDDLLPSVKHHLELLDQVGTDLQLISPRPYAMIHSLINSTVVGLWTRFVNDAIYQSCALAPDRLRPVAGLPQFRDSDITASVEELRRCVEELGFIGCLLNPDPLEGGAPPPPMSDRYWYPLYEEMCRLDVPALLHPASSSDPREPYSLHFILEESIAIMGLLNSDVFTDFPDLKIVVAHGGGAIPYQVGRFRAGEFRFGGEGDFEQRLRRLYFDTCLYSPSALRLLIEVVGADRVLFGSERPGTGSPVDPKTGTSMDDLKPVIEGLDVVDAESLAKIFETNVRAVYGSRLLPA
jgi:4-oxalmesaconate hydratase